MATRQTLIARAFRAVALLLACTVLPLGASGCAPSIASWIVKERNHQGDVALARGNYPDASVAYQLAIKLDPANAHARTGLTTGNVGFILHHALKTIAAELAKTGVVS